MDSGYYMAYNIVAITAAKDTFIEWEDLLTECLKTLKYSDIFENNIRGAIERDFFQARCINQNFNQTMDGIMSSWDSRNKSIDIISQKQRRDLRAVTKAKDINRSPMIICIRRQ